MYPMNFDMTGMSMGTELGSLGSGGIPMRAAQPQMSYGTPLSAGNIGGYMPPTGAAGAGATAGKAGSFLGNFANLADGLSGLGQLFIGLKSLGIAKDQLAFSKEAFNTNMANQKKTYNTSLEDRIRSRYVTEGRTSGEADSYLARNNL